MLLILDLDETLIHATEQKLEEEPDFIVFDYFVYKRPFLDEFIEECGQRFDLAVWSSAAEDYVQEIVKQIFPASINLKFVWSRNRCTPKILLQLDEFYNYNLDVNSYYHYTKQLKKVSKKGFDLKQVLIVDDTPSKVVNSYGNAIYIKEYKGESSDKELKFLAKYLLVLKDVENVRTIEKRGWRKLTI
ncbi:TFIIF-interacting CTD phosphatase [Cylindrospermum stagnale PCC 7417]|uniref:TFIIF-interacting CTD phosphatase n=1 Tax=Cylindrospermum stagnale PCC 7417 TaxID=56107 RepID=K9WVR7_9NOST|nr:HAD family hydrolase [Cylindrospermum stagnale]AFZ24475.1 TFIIF-interacting CTD phosphatase [Cylindrospermum stagnale PCC 7417]